MSVQSKESPRGSEPLMHDMEPTYSLGLLFRLGKHQSKPDYQGLNREANSL